MRCNADEAPMGEELKLFAGLFVDMRGTQHSVTRPFGGKRNRSQHERTSVPEGLGDFLSGPVHKSMVVRPELDEHALLHSGGFRRCLSGFVR